MSKVKQKLFLVAATDFSVNAFLINHLRALSQHFEVTVVVNTHDPLFLKKQGLSLNVIPVSISRKVNIFSDLFCLFRLIYLFIENKPAAVHSITPKAGLLSMLAAFVSFVPLRVHTFTGQVWVTKQGFKRLFLKGFDRLIARLATFNIVDSPSQQQFLIDEKVLCKSNSVVFGLGSVSGVDLKRFKSSKAAFNELRHTLGISDDAFVFTYLGRLNKDKGVLDLAQAFSRIKDSNAYLLIVGPDEGGFVDEIKKKNAHKLEQIRFVGFTKVPEQYLAASNALCLPSYREGFGSVIIEAAAMGVPAIASDIYGISDAVVKNQTGLLHKPADVSSILACLNSFLNDPKLVKKYGDAAKLRAAKDFDANLISEHWVDFYKRYIN
jgi:glycosyltransferase involved in cell wall biosynthesis